MPLVIELCSGASGKTYPCTGVQHARSKDVANAGSKVVEVTGQDNGLLAQTSRGDLGNDGVADGSDCDVVDAGECKEESTDGPLSASVTPVNGTAGSNDNKNDDHSQITKDIESATSDTRNESPGNEDTDGADSVLTKGHGEGV